MEFTLVLPVLITLFLGVLVAGGVGFHSAIDEQHLAAAAVRWAAVDSEHGEGTELTEANFLRWVKEQGDTSNVREAHVTMCSPHSELGEWVEVRLAYVYNWFKLLPFTTPMETHAKMRIEKKPVAPFATTC